MNKEIWKKLSTYTDEELMRAIAFYSQSPDGQYDELAALCILAIKEQRDSDRRYLR